LYFYLNGNCPLFTVHSPTHYNKEVTMIGNKKRGSALSGAKAAVWGFAVLALVFSLGLIGCGGDDYGDPPPKVVFPDKLLGKWGAGSKNLEFSNESTAKLYIYDTAASQGHSYYLKSVSGDTYTVTMSDKTGTFKAEVSGSTLTISEWSGEVFGDTNYNGTYPKMTSGWSITYTALANGNASVTSTQINFEFSAAVTELDAGDITIGGTPGAANKVSLTGNGTDWSLAITTTTAGAATVSISKSGIEGGTKPITLYKASIGDPALYGKWNSNNNTNWLLFNDDGTGNYTDNTFSWLVSGNVLTIVGNPIQALGGTNRFNYLVSGSGSGATLSLTEINGVAASTIAAMSWTHE
jgi:hypothetical protein